MTCSIDDDQHTDHNASADILDATGSLWINPSCPSRYLVIFLVFFPPYKKEIEIGSAMQRRVIYHLFISLQLR